MARKQVGVSASSSSTKSKTQACYKKLAEGIWTGYKVAINAIYNEHDHEAGHLTRKLATRSKASASRQRHRGKKIIVIMISSQEEEPSKWLQKKLDYGSKRKEIVPGKHLQPRLPSLL